MQHKRLKVPRSIAARASCEALLEVAPSFGKDWVLIGGLMVAIHASGHTLTMERETTDADIVADVRARQSSLAHIDRVLCEAGFVQSMSGNSNVGHRYRRGEAIIDVLAPDRVGDRNPLALGAGTTLSARGSTRALLRAETVIVEFESIEAPIRLPSPVGALVVKGYALYHNVPGGARSPLRHKFDLVTLLRCTVLSENELPLSKSEQKILRLIADDKSIPEDARGKLNFFLARQQKAKQQRKGISSPVSEGYEQ